VTRAVCRSEGHVALSNREEVQLIQVHYMRRLYINYYYAILASVPVSVQLTNDYPYSIEDCYDVVKSKDAIHTTYSTLDCSM
jgi:hypothetical protein